MDQIFSELRSVQAGDIIDFHCQKCARCCRNVREAIMVTPLDAYRLTRCFNRHGRNYEDILEFYNEFCEPVCITDHGFMIYTLKTFGFTNDCVFLKGGRCSAYEARPYTCRLYPFSADYNPVKQDFQYYLCTERPHHMSGGRVRVGQWIHENLNSEDKEYLKAEHTAMILVGKLLSQVQQENRSRCLIRLVYILYSGYSLKKPFLPQYNAHLTRLIQALKAEI